MKNSKAYFLLTCDSFWYLVVTILFNLVIFIFMTQEISFLIKSGHTLGYMMPLLIIGSGYAFIAFKMVSHFIHRTVRKYQVRKRKWALA